MGASGRPSLRIGLVNNMPDAALLATERQFARLLATAAPGFDIRLQFFALAGVERSSQILGRLRGRYADAETLPSADLDGLIVTGAEPSASELDSEPYWPALTRLVDWTQASATPVIWSCLAAHAAVLHLDGVRRRPLAAKLSGVFACQRANDDAFGRLPPKPMFTPHSRQNELLERDLTTAGYQILTHSETAGVDSFSRRGRSFSLFLQGHPEYAADSLLREYARDVSRYLHAERPTHPAAPCGYFDAPTEIALGELAERATRRKSPELLAEYTQILGHAAPVETWRSTAVQLYGAWLGQIGDPMRPATPEEGRHYPFRAATSVALADRL
jgi:homoserine O-succinyltransferase